MKKLLKVQFLIALITATTALVSFGGCGQATQNIETQSEPTSSSANTSIDSQQDNESADAEESSVVSTRSEEEILEDIFKNTSVTITEDNKFDKITNAKLFGEIINPDNDEFIMAHYADGTGTRLAEGDYIVIFEKNDSYDLIYCKGKLAAINTKYINELPGDFLSNPPVNDDYFSFRSKWDDTISDFGDFGDQMKDYWDQKRSERIDKEYPPIVITQPASEADVIRFGETTKELKLNIKSEHYNSLTTVEKGSKVGIITIGDNIDIYFLGGIITLDKDSITLFDENYIPSPDWQNDYEGYDWFGFRNRDPKGDFLIKYNVFQGYQERE